MLLSGAWRWPGHQLILRKRNIRFPTECSLSDTLCTSFSNFKFIFAPFWFLHCRIPESEFDPQCPQCLWLRWADIGHQRHANRALLWRSRFLVVVPTILLLTGPKTNWIVGTKSSIGVDSNTVIIDKLTESGEVRDLNKCCLLTLLFFPFDHLYYTFLLD